MTVLRVLVGIPLLLLVAEFVRISLGFSGAASGLLAWILAAALALAGGWLALTLVIGIIASPARPRRSPAPPRAAPGLEGSRPRPPVPGSARGPSAAARAREASARLGGGAYLGVDEHGGWVTADAESAVLVLGPPRSGKTSAVMIPALMASYGPALSTSTKPDVMRATLPARAEIGQAWLFDPAASETDALPDGVRRLCWSPVAAAVSWDQALVTARAMTAAANPGAGTTNETHWSERAAALLAPLLYAAQQTGQPIAQVLAWTLRQDLKPAQAILADSDTPIAADVLAGIQATDQRERSSILSATAGVLAAYNSNAARETAANPNFDPHQFTASTDTIYITAPEHQQALTAPLIVGLLEQIRHATYHHHRTHPDSTGPPMLWALDELANTAPIHDLPALISQAGGQRLQVIAGLQDLAQARARWGQHHTDALLSLFQTKLILTGVQDPHTLEAISLALGEYDRDTIAHTLGDSQPDQWFPTHTHSDTVSYHTQRQRTLTPGDIARLPHGHALHLQGTSWTTIQLTPWHETEPWRRIAAIAAAENVSP